MLLFWSVEWSSSKGERTALIHRKKNDLLHKDVACLVLLSLWRCFEKKKKNCTSAKCSLVRSEMHARITRGPTRGIFWTTQNPTTSTIYSILTIKIQTSTGEPRIFLSQCVLFLFLIVEVVLWVYFDFTYCRVQFTLPLFTLVGIILIIQRYISSYL